MTVIKTLIGTNENGTPRFHYDFSNEDPEQVAALFTGPIAGTVALHDGTAYDVTEDVIAVHPSHVGPVLHHIHKMHNAAGRFDPHVCTAECGDET